MDKKRWLLIVIILLIVLSSCVATALNFLKKYENVNLNDYANRVNNTNTVNQFAAYDEGIIDTRSNDEEVNVDSMTEMKMIENCIQKYYNTIDMQASMYFDPKGQRMVFEEEINEKILKLLDGNYKTENNINSLNIDNYVKKTNKNYFVIPLEMKKITKSPYEKYLVYGILIDADYSENIEFYIYVNINYVEGTFSIIPLNSNEKKFDDLKINNNIGNIQENEENSYETPGISDQKIALEYFRRNKLLSLVAPDIAYKYLDENYRDKRFGSLENYKKYIDDNREWLEISSVSKYKATVKGGLNEYICQEKNDNYFIVDAKSALNYTIYLDNYTIDSSDFIEKYDPANNQTKVGLNIEKIKMALNVKDYDYVYGKLDETFKKNNFATINDFENYCKENFPSTFDVTYNDFSQKGNGVYTYNVKLSFSDTGDMKDKTFAIKLKGDRDFVMSFNVN